MGIGYLQRPGQRGDRSKGGTDRTFTYLLWQISKDNYHVVTNRGQAFLDGGSWHSLMKAGLKQDRRKCP
jgi:hypothetical protein